MFRVNNMLVAPHARGKRLNDAIFGVAAAARARSSQVGAANVINASIDEDKFKPIIGSSFSAAYVSGVAALVRAKFPQLPAAEVIHRLTATAHAPAGGRDNVIGYGVVDPLAALTWDVPPAPAKAPTPTEAPLHVPPPPPPPDPRPARMLAAQIGAGVVLVSAVLWGTTVWRRKQQR